MAFVDFPANLQALLQTGMLEREMEEGLDSILAYRELALCEFVPNRIGETVTRTRKGRKTPVTTAMDPSTNTGLDNGLTPSSFSIEQYTFSLFQIGDTCDLNLMMDQAAIASEFIANARNNAVQAGQSLERFCRAALFGAYLSGNTRVLASPAPTTTTAHLNDIRGFTTVLVNGVPTAISVSNPLTASEYSVAAGLEQTLTITGVAADVVNVSDTPDGISGTITFAVATAPVANNAIVGSNAPAVLRSFGKLTTIHLTASNVLTFGLFLDAEAYLRDNGVPPMEDGTYHAILTNTSMRQLFSDPQFQILFAASYKAQEYQDGQVVSLGGMTFIPSTEPYVRVVTNIDGINVRIQRPILCGAESIIQGNYEGMDHWLDELGLDDMDSQIAMVDGIVQIVREPLDRLQSQVAQSWTWIGAFAVPTDITATTSIIPTASSALYKRCVAMEHVG